MKMVFLELSLHSLYNEKADFGVFVANDVQRRYNQGNEHK